MHLVVNELANVHTAVTVTALICVRSLNERMQIIAVTNFVSYPFMRAVVGGYQNISTKTLANETVFRIMYM